MVFFFNHNGTTYLFLQVLKIYPLKTWGIKIDVVRKERAPSCNVSIILSKTINFPFYFTSQIKRINMIVSHTRTPRENRECLLCCKWRKPCGPS